MIAPEFLGRTEHEVITYTEHFGQGMINIEPHHGSSIALLALLGLVAWIVLIIGAVVVLS
jgi:hypothetical protein